MSIKSIKTMLVGGEQPDPDKPENKERAERERNAGKKFASVSRIDKAGAKIQSFACKHRDAFLVIVFSIIILLTTWNVYRLMTISRYRAATKNAAVIQEQKKVLDNERHTFLPLNEKEKNK